MRKKVALLGVFLALALICSYIESLIPFYFGVPGMKLGLTNIVVVLLLYFYGTKEALAVSFMRILLAGFMFGNAFSILYSLAGGLLSLFVMALLKKTGWFHMIAVSICGGIIWGRSWWLWWSLRITISSAIFPSFLSVAGSRDF